MAAALVAEVEGLGDHLGRRNAADPPLDGDLDLLAAGLPAAAIAVEDDTLCHGFLLRVCGRYPAGSKTRLRAWDGLAGRGRGPGAWCREWGRCLAPAHLAPAGLVWAAPAGSSVAADLAGALEPARDSATREFAADCVALSGIPAAASPAPATP